MTELEYIEKRIETITRLLNRTKTVAPTFEELISSYENELATLNSIKQKLEAFEIIKLHTIIRVNDNVLTITNGLKNGTIETLISKQETDTLKEVLK